MEEVLGWAILSAVLCAALAVLLYLKQDGGGGGGGRAGAGRPQEAAARGPGTDEREGFFS